MNQQTNLQALAYYDMKNHADDYQAWNYDYEPDEETIKSKNVDDKRIQKQKQFRISFATILNMFK